ncbi:MAG: hypothetical protein QOI94_2706, partial [Acidobacteriaceae bacterium]|nr:hypothetical protein [Acidobacteriaceae bacterium]
MAPTIERRVGLRLGATVKTAMAL